jgi:hypothetical protein
MPWLHKYLGNPVLSWLGKLFFKVPVGDFHCGLRGFRKASIDALGLTTPGMEFASEMLVMAQKKGLKIKEVPVTLSPDLRTRAPHLKTWRDGWRHLRFLLMHSPTWAFLVPGIVLAVAAATLVLIAIFGQFSIGDVSFSYKTGIAVSALGVLSTTAIWSTVLAKAALGEKVTKSRVPLGALVLMFALVAILGAIILFLQLFSWASNGFGAEPLNTSLLWTTLASFMVTSGGTSTALGLLVGLLRATK